MPRQEWGGIEPMGEVFLLTFLFIGLVRVGDYPDMWIAFHCQRVTWRFLTRRDRHKRSLAKLAGYLLRGSANIAFTSASPTPAASATRARSSPIVFSPAASTNPCLALNRSPGSPATSPARPPEPPSSPQVLHPQHWRNPGYAITNSRSAAFGTEHRETFPRNCCHRH
jgi:hypothetical protein